MVIMHTSSSNETVHPALFNRRKTNNNLLENQTASFNPGFLMSASRLNENRERLQLMKSLQFGWDGEHAQEISLSLIQNVEYMISDLIYQPEIQPTAAGSIQLEYERENGDYLEIELTDEEMEIFKSLSRGIETLEVAELSSNRINRELNDFYA
ncbi:hypothetical protein [Bhargavaea cecembensis]|uniref:hypothetical protein n=1 Tax=Bhargavaea cecembensis TaxID=394098 RepID=UPI0006940205|nr:hypothetical protein [Bhargavaea cecembensis]